MWLWPLEGCLPLEFRSTSDGQSLGRTRGREKKRRKASDKRKKEKKDSDETICYILNGEISTSSYASKVPAL